MNLEDLEFRRIRRRQVDELLRQCRSYEGPAPHFLLSAYIGRGDLVFACYLSRRLVSEDAMYAFLQALIAESPDVLTLTRDGWGGLLHLALACTTSRRIHLLLAVPGTTRLLDNPNTRQTPLHVACGPGVLPEVIHHLIDLDPDVLTVPDSLGQVPLHLALVRNPTSDHVQRMIQLAPETLHARDNQGQTPVERAIGSMGTREGPAAALRQLVAAHPRSVSPPDTAVLKHTALMRLCERPVEVHPELVRTVLDACPRSLLLPFRCVWRSRISNRLPFEMTSDALSFAGMGMEEELATAVTKETVLMALAVMEYVLHLSASALRADGTYAPAADNVEWFQDHIKDALHAHVPGVLLERPSGLSVAQSLWRLYDRTNPTGSIVDVLVRLWFCDDRAAKLLRGESRLFRNVVLCETVVDLYHLNRQGRYRRIGEPSHPLANQDDDAGNEDGNDVLAAGMLHQIDLLASLGKSRSVESVYLQFREVAHHALIVLGPRRMDSGGDGLP